METQTSKMDVMKSPMWKVFVYFLGYLAWVHGRAVREDMQPHMAAVLSSRHCMQEPTDADLLLDEGYFCAVQVIDSITEFAHMQIPDTIMVKIGVNQGKETILSGTKPEDATADLAVSWHR